ncbi:hypothetical protein GCM10017562_00920 [Streptomyces roseofulvus]
MTIVVACGVLVRGGEYWLTDWPVHSTKADEGAAEAGRSPSEPSAHAAPRAAMRAAFRVIFMGGLLGLRATAGAPVRSVM